MFWREWNRPLYYPNRAPQTLTPQTQSPVSKLFEIGVIEVQLDSLRHTALQKPTFLIPRLSRCTHADWDDTVHQNHYTHRSKKRRESNRPLLPRTPPLIWGAQGSVGVGFGGRACCLSFLFFLCVKAGRLWCHFGDRRLGPRGYGGGDGWEANSLVGQETYTERGQRLAAKAHASIGSSQTDQDDGQSAGYHYRCWNFQVSQGQKGEMERLAEVLCFIFLPFCVCGFIASWFE